MRKKVIDKPFLFITLALLGVGIFIFISASLGILARNPDLFRRMLITQLLYAIVGGGASLFLFSRIPYTFWKKHALWIGIGSLAISILVFVPGLGFEHGGARRWISLGFITFQPVELLKIGFAIYLASWLTKQHKEKQFTNWRKTLFPFAAMLALIGLILLAEPDTGSLLVIVLASISTYFIAGAKLRDFLVLVAIGIVVAASLLAIRPYLLDRVKTFLDPSHDPRGSSYQIRQSLITIGSGGIFGRGYGQGIQKHTYLPEPHGDSIFAVAGEELGFVGLVIIVGLYMAFLFRGLRIAGTTKDMFARLLVTGIVVLIVVQSFLNIASVIGLFPLTGLPLIFISHGGTALVISLAGVGIILNVSRYNYRTRNKIS